MERNADIASCLQLIDAWCRAVANYRRLVYLHIEPDPTASMSRAELDRELQATRQQVLDSEQAVLAAVGRIPAAAPQLAPRETAGSEQ